jgi:SAM-dependent methyltransferase
VDERDLPVESEDSHVSDEAWGAAARGYKDYWVPRFRPFMMRALTVFAPPPDGPVAVPGCGPGEEVVLLLKKFPGRNIIATDPSNEMLQLLRASLHERGYTTALAASGRAEDLSSTIRQAAGVLSCFSLQLVPHPVRALEEWATVLRPGGVLVALFWPAPPPGSAFARLATAIEFVSGERRRDWEAEALRELPRLGLLLERDDRVSREIEHASPEELFQALVDWGPLQVFLRKRGRDVVDRCRRAWIGNHGLQRRGSGWVHTAEARLWVARKTGEGSGDGH